MIHKRPHYLGEICNKKIMKENIFYIDGRFVPKSQAVISVCDLGLLRCYAAFEALRTYNRKPFYLKEHIERLENSLHEMHIPKPPQFDDLSIIIDTLIDKNPDTELTFRIIVTAGINEELTYHSINPSLIIHALPAKRLPDSFYEQGSYVITTTASRILPHVKSTNYLEGSIALAKARKLGATDVIYMDKELHLLELTRSNLFFVKDNTLITPEHDVLPGITRTIVMGIAKRLGIPYRQERIKRSDISKFDEAFHTSSIKEVVPIVKIDDIPIQKGPLTQKLMQAYRERTQGL